MYRSNRDGGRRTRSAMGKCLAWALVWFATPAFVHAQGSRVISANEEDSIPVQSDSDIHVNAYHLIGTSSSALLSQATDYFSRTQYGKPIIVSGDGGTPPIDLFDDVLDMTGSDGVRHYEHYDNPLDVQTTVEGVFTGIADVPAVSLQYMEMLGARATPLAPGGTLTRVGNQLRWNDQPVVLMGSSVYGMLSTTRHNMIAYLDVLAGRGINFTRTWCVEQWTGLAMHNDFTTGLTPFVGKHPLAGAGNAYDLTQLNDAFFARLRAYVEAAAARGIVVQVTIFERNGLRRPPGSPNELGRWIDSPYNDANNVQNYFTIVAPAVVPVGFTGMDGTDVGAVNRSLTERVVEELHSFGNVIYEIMNEPQRNMPDEATEAAWHNWVAGILTDKLNEYSTTGPTITQQPQPAAVHQNQTAYFTVAAMGEGTLTYQWQRDSISLTDGGRISGAGTPTLAIAQARATDPASYRCVVTHAAGQTISDEAALMLSALGDFDRDMDVDQVDFGHFQACLSGLVDPAPGCEDADLDLSDGVGPPDFGIFVNCMAGPDQPPGC